MNVACRHDVPGIAALAEVEMPSMTFLHRGGWEEAYRFGAGNHARDSYFVVVRQGEDGPVVAFCWADAALFDDHGIEEPWWCVNAVAVTSAYRRKRLGAALVSGIKRRAAEAGISTLYGVCYPDSVAFWRSQGFDVTARGGALVADRKVRRVGSEPVELAPLTDEAGDHMIVSSRAADEVPGVARLVLQEE